MSVTPASQHKALYFQWLFKNRNNYGMTSCPRGKKAGIADRYEGLILLLGMRNSLHTIHAHSRQSIYIENRMKLLFPSR